MLCLLRASPALAAGFADWAVVLVAGDDHAHSGAPSQVFDNARRDLANAFASIGFSPAQHGAILGRSRTRMRRQTDAADIANALWDLTNRATGGCLIYFTSPWHAQPAS